MGLSSDLLTQFAKITKTEEKTNKETTVYGTAVTYMGSTYVRFDGSELLTPVITTADFEDGERVSILLKDHTATITGNLSSPSARNKTVNTVKQDVESMGEVIADVVRTEQLMAESARIDSLVTKTAKIDTLEADNVTINNRLSVTEALIKDLTGDSIDVENLTATFATILMLDVERGRIDTLVSDNATINETLTAASGRIDRLQADKLDANAAAIAYAKIADLNSVNADIASLKSNVADIDTLIFGSATGSTIQTSFANSVIAQLGDARIKSAMIESMSASKITSGDIITNNVRVKSNSGSLIISDETMQISDSTRVRVQIGKDASGDYSINIWDSSGNLMFSKGGITDSAIKQAIIRNEMVSDTANIAAHKLDIDSLFDEINGSTNTIKSTKVYLDDEKQTLDVAFSALSTNVTELGETVSSQGTAISVMQGQISSKIWQQDINAVSDELNETTETLSTQYSTLSQKLDGVSSTVASHTSQIQNKADSSTVTTVSNKVSSLETNLSGFKTTVGNTYATKTALSDTNAKVTAAETSISENAKAISLRATQSEVATAKSEAISAASSDATTKANNALSSANANTSTLLKDYSKTADMNAAIELKADSITNAVSTTYATKASLNTTNTNVNSLGTRMTSAETNLTQLSSKITANVTETTNLGTRVSTVEQTASGLTTRLDDQTIGGTNILRGTNSVSSLGTSSSWSAATWRAAGGGTGERTVINITDAPNAEIKKGFRIAGDDTDTTTAQDSVPVTAGVQYTLSCYARGTGTLRLQVGKSPYSAVPYTLTDVTTWTKYSLTFVAGTGNGMSNGATNVYIGNRGTGELEVCGFKMEIGNVATDWTPSPYDFDSGITSASKTATDYLSFSGSGLVVGDMTKSTLGNNVLVDSDSVDIRNGSTILASFGAKTVTLGRNAEDSVIDLCNGAGRISANTAEASTSYPHRNAILFESQELEFESVRYVANVSNEYGATSTPSISREAELYMLRSSSSSTESCARLQSQHTTNSSGAYTKAGISAMTYDSASSTRTLIFASDSASSAYNQINVYPTKTNFNKPLYRYISGHEYAVVDESMDSGWINVTSLGSDFVAYGTDENSKVRYRKFGKMVEIRGAVKPAKVITGSADNYTIFTLPSGYRPDGQVCERCQGSGSYSWLVSVTSGGVVRFSRYNDGAKYVDTSTSSWLPFHLMFFIG